MSNQKFNKKLYEYKQFAKYSRDWSNDDFARFINEFRFYSSNNDFEMFKYHVSLWNQCDFWSEYELYLAFVFCGYNNYLEIFNFLACLKNNDIITNVITDEEYDSRRNKYDPLLIYSSKNETYDKLYLTFDKIINVNDIYYNNVNDNTNDENDNPNDEAFLKEDSITKKIAIITLLIVSDQNNKDVNNLLLKMISLKK